MHQLAHCPSQLGCKPIPYGLVSLWDMMNFNLNSFVVALKLLRQERDVAIKRVAVDANSTLTDDDRRRLLDNFELGIAPSLHALFIADDRVARVYTLIGPDDPRPRYADIAYELNVVEEEIEDKCKYERFYHYPRDKGSMVLRVPGDWAATLKAFPSAREDVEAAVDCYALGRNHASIHHSMMVLERGLPALAKRLDVSFNPKKATWKDLTKGITDNITKKRLAMSHQPKGSRPLSRAAATRESAFLDACEEAAIEFRYFTSIWRNHIAHGRADYDENDAKKVLEHVRTFMEVIALKLKLKERKI